MRPLRGAPHTTSSCAASADIWPSCVRSDPRHAAANNTPRPCASSVNAGQGTDSREAAPSWEQCGGRDTASRARCSEQASTSRASSRSEERGLLKGGLRHPGPTAPTRKRAPYQAARQRWSFASLSLALSRLPAAGRKAFIMLTMRAHLF